MQKNKKVTVISLVILVAVVAVMAVCWFTFKPSATAGEKELTILVTHGDASTKTFTVNTSAEFLGDALVAEGLIQGEEAEYGLYVRAVDGETADEAIQQWWGYTKGGETVNYGVDMCPIADGEQYEFTLNTGW